MPNHDSYFKKAVANAKTRQLFQKRCSYAISRIHSWKPYSTATSQWFAVGDYQTGMATSSSFQGRDPAHRLPIAKWRLHRKAPTDTDVQRPCTKVKNKRWHGLSVVRTQYGRRERWWRCTRIYSLHCNTVEIRRHMLNGPACNFGGLLWWR